MCLLDTLYRRNFLPYPDPKILETKVSITQHFSRNILTIGAIKYLSVIILNYLNLQNKILYTNNQDIDQ